MSAQPVRITLSRAKGWRLPPNTVKVDRSTKWGNPFKVPDDPAMAVLCFTFWIDRIQDYPNKPQPPSKSEVQDALRGKNLACWCKPGAWCHADILLDVANASETAVTQADAGTDDDQPPSP